MSEISNDESYDSSEDLRQAALPLSDINDTDS